MTQPTPEDLDDAAKAAGFNDYAHVRSCWAEKGEGVQSIRAHATRIAAHRATQAELAREREAFAKALALRPTTAERDELYRVLGEIDRIAEKWTWGSFSADSTGRQKVAALAAPYRVKVDQDAEDAKALFATMKYIGAPSDIQTALETFTAKFREIVAQRGDRV